MIVLAKLSRLSYFSKLFHIRSTLISQRNVNERGISMRNMGNVLPKSGSFVLRSNTWFGFILGVGTGALYVSIKKEEKSDELKRNENGLLVKLYRCLPLKMSSRLWGNLNSLELPLILRTPILKLYSWCFNCNINEAVIQDLTLYSNLGQFFNRRLRSNLRPINKHFSIVSPCDGKILHLGKADNDTIEQVKNINYSICDFIGNQSWLAESNSISELVNVKNMTDSQRKDYISKLKHNPDNDIYHCVLYLAPGDYHGFHSPTDWIISYRRHIPGELLSVNPGICRLVKGLFNINERVLYLGSWEQGFMSMTAVGATNVGSIHVFHDKSLHTNQSTNLFGEYFDKDFRFKEFEGVPMLRGSQIGDFSLGSTIVLVFEAPKNFVFFVESGDKIKYGKPLGCYKNCIVNSS